MPDKFVVEYTDDKNTWTREFDSEEEATLEVYNCNRHAMALIGYASYCVTAIYIGKVEKE